MKMSELDRRTRYSIKAIRSAMFELLETKSLDSITVTNICAIADINRGTFYKYYRDVYDLFEKTENDFIEEIYTLISKSEATCSEMPDFFAHVFHILSENSDYVQIAKNREFTERFTQKLLSVVLPQINQLIINNDPDASQEEVKFLSEYIIGGCTYVIAAWIRDNMKTPAERMEEYITGFITRSLMRR